MSIKWNYKLVKEYIENLGYELISGDYKNNRQKLIIRDKDQFYYSINFDNFYSGKRPRIADTRSEFSIINIKNWLKLNDKNFLLISENYVNKDENLKWKCLKDECGEMFEMSWHNVLKGQNCSVCRGLQVGLSNCLATKNPIIAKEWHSTKNGDLTPYDVTCGCNKYAWWQCEKGHEWYSVISSRISNNCPYCFGHLPTDDYNLLVCSPDLCKEWDYDKNDKSPREYCLQSNLPVFWVCHKCGHTWKASICNRTNGNTNCPLCSISNGEKFIVKILKQYDISNIPQYKFRDCKNIKPLPFDFYLSDYNICIEYQGIQHYEPVVFFGGEEQFKIQQYLDQIKRDYCKFNHINLLEIPYWDFDNIETILNNHLVNFH